MEQQERMLTDIERKMVEDSHDLIFIVADCIDADVTDCYDLLAIGLCHAAQQYSEKNRLCSFDEFAKVVMMNEYLNYQYQKEFKSNIDMDMFEYLRSLHVI